MISVLTSVYNEEENEIREALDSILSQSYTDFELIIVVDKPDNEKAINLLDEYRDKDDRVKVIVNEKNIGLALSMNVAAEAAGGEYLLRMDADDVCYPNRFQMQYDCINGSEYDLVCGNYDFMDEDGELLPQKVKVYNDKQMHKLMPMRNIIHHPTVIMRADAFRKMGGYRNYKCTQDYDLWLRMLCAGFRMHMMPEKLIKYRVRAKSVTIMSRYKQSCTGEYIRSLYKNKMFGYSYDGYLEYLKKHNAEEKATNEDFMANSKLYMDSKRALAKGKIIEGVCGLAKVFFASKYYRPHFIQSMRIALITKLSK